MPRRSVALLAWLVLAALPLGCDTGPSVEDLTVHNRLKGVAALYGRYQGKHRGQPPKNQQEFEQYLKSLDPQEYATFDATSPGDLFVSPRDGKPFVIKYGTNAGPPGADGSTPIIAHEAPSEGSAPLGVTTMGEIRELDAAAGS
jgi:hypothetical protein